MTPKCAVCISSYDLRAYPVVGRCGHSICQLCSVGLLNSKCPICRSVDSFLNYSKNHRVYEMVKDIFVKTAEDEQLLQRIQVLQEEIRLKRNSITALRRQLEHQDDDESYHSDSDDIPDGEFALVEEMLSQFSWENVESARPESI